MSSNLGNKEIMAKNISRLMNLNNVDRNKLSKELDVKYTTLSDWINGKTYPRIDKIELLANYFGVSKAELVEDTPTNVLPVTGFQRIPVIGKIACGDPITAIENITEYREVPKDYLNYSGELFFLEATGDSMEPKIPDGSYVLCRKQEDVESGEIAAVLVNGDEETTLKKVIKQGKTILLQPLNESYSPYIVTKENPAKIVGKALRVDTEL